MVQHGNNAFARNSRNRATYVLGWEYEIPTASASGDEIMRLVKKQVNFVRACFKKNGLYSIVTQLLDYIGEHSPEDHANPRHKAGLFKVITRGVTDTKGVETQMAKETVDFFGHLCLYIR